MRPFAYQRPTDAPSALQALAVAAANQPLSEAAAQPLAGGTTLIDLMKLDVMRPGVVVDINALAPAWSAINLEGGNLRLGALARMSDVAANQRTRCSYFRDVSYGNCNKRIPGSGCAALEGFNRTHAVLGTSDQCIATYPGDFAQALIALDASVDITGKSGVRTIPFAQLHKAPGNSPQIETTLAAGELISGFSIPGRWPRSVYLKARDRQSYEFALSSTAVALDVQDGVVRDARLALGGVATTPWRAREAEALLKGQKFDDGLAQRVAEAAFAGARASKHNAFKIALGKRVVARALHVAAAMEV
jgi:xanthine dehydrogenase YagS FAD-binding subunit